MKTQSHWVVTPGKQTNIERTWLNDVMQTEIHTAEPLVTEPGAFEVEMAIEKLKRHKSPGIDQIPPELIKAVDRTNYSEIHNIVSSIRNKEELSEEWKQSITVPITRRVINQTVVIIEAYHFCQLHTKFYPTSWGQG